jgi:hypothetical protein
VSSVMTRHIYVVTVLGVTREYVFPVLPRVKVLGSVTTVRDSMQVYRP